MDVANSRAIARREKVAQGMFSTVVRTPMRVHACAAARPVSRPRMCRSVGT
jgi:hypothetical protein